MTDSLAGLPTVAVGDTTLAYREVGAGEPVVFVHGGLSDLRTWEPQLAGIGGRYRAISYSRRYARPNPDIAPGADDPWTRHVDDLAAFVGEIHAAPAHLVGNSQGAVIALLAALQHPERVRSLVLEEPPLLGLFASAPPRLRELFHLFATRPATALEMLRFGARTVSRVRRAFRGGDDEQAMRIFLDGVLGPGRSERLPPARLEQMRANRSTLRAAMLGSGVPPVGPADVERVGVPVLLLTGDESPPLLVALSARLGELLPRAEQMRIPGASHVMHEESPAAVNHAILGFLERLPRTA